VSSARATSDPVVVVGGGVIGLLSALACARAGADVVLLDRGRIPNPDATSFDETRIVRALHVGDVPTTRESARAEQEWRRLEARLHARFYHRVGALTVLRSRDLDRALATVGRSGITTEVLERSELGRRWPHIEFASDAVGLLEPDAGIVLAVRALEAMARRLAAHPRVELRPHHEVVEVDPQSRLVRVKGGPTIRSRRVLVAAGPWSRALLPPATTRRLSLYRQTMVYCRVPSRLARSWAHTPALPTLSPTRRSWLVPPAEEARLKLSAATACRRVAELTDRETPSRLRERVVAAFTGQLVGFDRSWITDARECYYLADSASGAAVMTTLGTATAWAYAACGGASFKLAPLVARSLARRVLALPHEPAAGRRNAPLVTIGSHRDEETDD
jgi:sarcosine oxidase